MNPIISTSSEKLWTGRVKIAKIVLIAGNANASCYLYDGSTGSGTEKIGIKTMANDSKEISFSPEGVEFSTGVYSTISGNDAKVYVYIR